MRRGERVLVPAVVLRVKGERVHVLLPAPECLGEPTIVGAIDAWVPIEALQPKSPMISSGSINGGQQSWDEG